MWKIVAGVILALACIQAQAFKDFLRPQARHIVGIVVDPEGKPVAEARIDHSNDRPYAHQSVKNDLSQPAQQLDHTTESLDGELRFNSRGLQV
jgi:hypothetical protein